MKVYIAKREYYEGYEIIAGFSTAEKAQAACDNDTFESGEKIGDFYRVEEFEVE